MLTDKVKAKILAMRKDTSAAAIAEILGLHQSTVYRVIANARKGKRVTKAVQRKQADADAQAALQESSKASGKLAREIQQFVNKSLIPRNITQIVLDVQEGKANLVYLQEDTVSF